MARDKNTPTRLARRLQPLMSGNAGDVVTSIIGGGASEGPGIDIPPSTTVIGVGLDSVLISHANGNPASEYDTIALALAAAASGDTVIIQRAGTYVESVTVPAGVSLIGLDRTKTIITGQVTLADGSVISNLSITRSLNSSDNVPGISGPATGTAYATLVTVSVTQAGAGDAYGILNNGGTVICKRCTIAATSTGGAGYGVYHAGTPAGPGTLANYGIRNDYPAASTAAFLDNFSFSMSHTPTGTYWPNVYFRWRLQHSLTLARGYARITVNKISSTNLDYLAISGVGDLDGINRFGEGNTNGTWSENGELTWTSADDDLCWQDSILELGWFGLGYNIAHAFQGQVMKIEWVVGETVTTLWAFGTPATGTTTLYYCIISGSTDDLNVAAGGTLNVYACQYDPDDVNGVITFLDGDRSAWDALSYPDHHANDIDAEGGIHHTLTDLDTRYSNGATYADDDVSNPPRSEEITAAFGGPATVGAGFLGLLDDSGLGTRVYLCASTGTGWAYIPFLRAVSGLDYETLTRFGTVLTPTSGEEYYIAEPSILYEDGIYKMWYRYGWDNPKIGYATSTDLLTWTKFADNPLLSNYYCPVVYKDGSTYHLYAVQTDWNGYDHYTSTDGITWVSAQTNTLTVGTSGAWDDYALGNPFVWKEGSTYYMLYEARAGDTAPWRLGLATSTDGNTWSKSGSNPVIAPTGSIGGPFVYKYGDTYYLWAHRSPSGFLPTDIVRYQSTDLTNWTDDGIQFARDGTDEGEGESVGQVADPTIAVSNGVMYLFYHASPDGSQAPVSATGIIKLATAAEGVIYGD